MAGLLVRLLAAGFYDGSALCAVSLFQKTLEIPRSLVADSETPEILLSLEGLLDALMDLCQNSGYGLAILSSSQASAASLTKTNAADYPYLSGIGELALQAGITASPLTGYSPQRWNFWIQRLIEQRQCGIENIELGAKSCLSSMYQAGEQTNLLPGLISQELIMYEE
ncbi:unnamed protein product [Clonostachys rhizophaga]|uniref:Uncharacterized protein n=1 Tax=Clonostachys rhizophaga TaxID=160324 RepID=A0A9N9V7P4_9HYPO|nr:unnamed protein product [Clonostachys rhizophaga]